MVKTGSFVISASGVDGNEVTGGGADGDADEGTDDGANRFGRSKNWLSPKTLNI